MFPYQKDMKELIKSKIMEFHTNGVPKLIDREIKIQLNTNKIVSIIGPRRSGKTYLMYQLIKNIKDITNVLYINLEDERLTIKAEDMDILLESYYELYPNKKNNEIFLFFDEIQEIEGWEKFIRRIYDSVSKNIFITGSSSKLLYKELATSLRGRSITYKVWPLSFREYLNFKNITKDITTTKTKAIISSNFKDYLTKGGFPETISMNNEVYEKTIKNYLEVMMFKDIAERNSISNTQLLKQFIKRIISNSGKEFTLNKIYNNLKSDGFKVSKDTVYSLIGSCEDAFLIFPLRNFSENINKQTIKKAYTVDNSFCSSVSFSLSKDWGRLLENLVYIELLRREHDVYYFNEEVECDFIIKDKERITETIQVCFDLNKDNMKREIEGLKRAMNQFKVKIGKIITMGKSQKLEEIEIINIFEWLLNQ